MKSVADFVWPKANDQRPTTISSHSENKNAEAAARFDGRFRMGNSLRGLRLGDGSQFRRFGCHRRSGCRIVETLNRDFRGTTRSQTILQPHYESAPWCCPCEFFSRDRGRQHDCDLRSSGFADHDGRRQARGLQCERVNSGGQKHVAPAGSWVRVNFPVADCAWAGMADAASAPMARITTLNSMELRIDFMT